MFIVANAMLNGGAPLVTLHRNGNAAFVQFAHCVRNNIACRVQMRTRKQHMELLYHNGICTIYADREEYTLHAIN